MSKIKLIGIGIAVLIASVLFMAAVEFATVKGHQLGVLETWGGGVETNVFTPKTYPLIPGFTKTMYTYDMNLQSYTLANYSVQASDNQNVSVTSTIRWKRDPQLLVTHHRMLKDNPEKRLLEPTMYRIIKDNLTMKKAIDGYSGTGLVTLQNDIEKALRADAELKSAGIIIESFAIVDSKLDPEFTKEIHGRQIATQKQLKAVEEEKAAEGAAKVAKALAQADFNKQVVEAERDAKMKVTAAEAANEQKVLEARAESQKLELESVAKKTAAINEAEGKKQAALAEAEGLLALGKAKAEAQKLQLQAFAVQGADAYTKVEISKNVATAFQGIKGFLPSDMKINLLTDSYNKAVDSLTGNPVVTVGK